MESETITKVPKVKTINLVFLHGFCESSKIWKKFAQTFEKDYNVLLLDLPGFGENKADQPNYSMEKAAEFVKDSLDQQVLEKCILIGHSMGGYVALAFAEKYPAMLSGLCLFHSSALADTEEKKQTRNKTIEFIQTNGVDVFMDSFVAPLFFEGNQEKNAKAIKKLTKIGKETPLNVVIGAIEAMRDRPDRTRILRELKVPVLFIAGKQDQAITLAQTLEQCHLPRVSQTLILDKTGHMGMFERPAQTKAALKGFIKYNLKEKKAKVKKPKTPKED